MLNRLCVKLLLFLSAWLMDCHSLQAQSGNHSQLLTDSKITMEKGDHEKAAKLAAAAFRAAESSGDHSGMGLALMAEADALLANPKRPKQQRKKASELLEKSLMYLNTTDDFEHRKSALETLVGLAQEQKDKQSEANFQKQLDVLLRAESSRAQLTEAITGLHTQQDLLSKKDRELRFKNKELSVKDEELSRLQLEAELEIALQKNKVDSLRFRMEADSLALLQSELLFKKQAAVLKLERTQNQLFQGILALLVLLAGYIFWRYRETKKTNQKLAEKNEIIEAERNRSETLLLNILPRMVAAELKIHGVAHAKRYEQVTVFFSDFVNFTSIAERMSPEELVELLDDYFKTFDEIITRYQLEKIKTIGDAYMCVGGLPEENPEHAVNVVAAALEIQRALGDKKREYGARGTQFFDARIGIHTGPVVSGVVGSKKFAFDIWGDTVNVAARMEHSGAPGKVNISESTYALVKSRFSCESRGMLPVKNRGDMTMYFVEDATSA